MHVFLLVTMLDIHPPSSCHTSPRLLDGGTAIVSAKAIFWLMIVNHILTGIHKFLLFMSSMILGAGNLFWSAITKGSASLVKRFN